MNKQFQQLNSLSQTPGQVGRRPASLRFGSRNCHAASQGGEPQTRRHERGEGRAAPGRCECPQLLLLQALLSQAPHCCSAVGMFWEVSREAILSWEHHRCSYAHLAAVTHRMPQLHERTTRSWATDLHDMQYAARSNCNSMVFVYLNMESVRQNMV